MTKPKDEAPNPLPQFSEQDQRSFGSRIVRRRRGQGWNQKELALRTAIQSSRLSRLERGRVAPKLDELLRLKAVLGGTLDELLFEPEPSPAGLGQLLHDLELSATVEEIQMVSKLMRLLALGFRCTTEGDIPT